MPRKLRQLNRKEDVVECELCGKTAWGDPHSLHELRIHEYECDGYDDPRERFVVGDRVIYSDFGLERLGRDQREGEVVAFCELDHCVRVLWDGRKTSVRLAHSFLRKVGV